MTKNALTTLLDVLPQARKVVQGGFDPAEIYVAAARKRLTLSRVSLLVFVVLPVLGAIVFYGFLASPRYVSEAQFIVRSISGHRTTGIEQLFRTIGLSRTVDDAYAVQKYLQSRDVVDALEKKGIGVDKIYSWSKGDFFSSYPRFWRKDTSEARYDYFIDRVTIVEDSVIGITTLRVVTFNKDDSQRLARELLLLAEQMVNRMNERAQQDIVSVAQSEVRLAEAHIIETQAKLAVFRNTELLIDPVKSSAGILDTIASLNAEISFAAAQLAELKVSSPASPAIPSLSLKISTLEERVRIEREKLTGGSGALSEKLATYQQLVLQRELAEKSLASAIKALDSARQDARRQHIYIEPVVMPRASDEPSEPRRLRSIFTVLVLGFAIHAIIWILSVGAGEHAH